MHDKLTLLKGILGDIAGLEAAAAVLSWDQAVWMPPGGMAARGRQMALLARLTHERLTSAELGALIDDLVPYGQSLPYESDDASLIRVAQRDWERATRVPPAFVAELAEHQAATYSAWTRAKEASDFGLVADHLSRMVDLSRRYSDFFPERSHPADPLIDENDPGVTTALLRPVFAELRARLVPLVRRSTASGPVNDSCLYATYPAAEQEAFCTFLQRRIGYDFMRGRRDRSPHPFTTSFGVDDVRLTVRVRENDLSEALFGCLHETGHALYELGAARGLDGSILAGGVSSGLHESQSRLWENMVGRSRAFWIYFYPRLQGAFPEQLGDVTLETFYRAINRVSPSLIRTEADEVTYNIHVMIRFDLECRLLEGHLTVKDLPDAWDALYESDLGVTPPTVRDGVLQDVHWYSGMVGGAFQGYTLGNIIGAHLHAAALEAHPVILSEMESGRFDLLLGWLGERIHVHGRKFLPDELIRRALGSALTVDPYIRYLTEKYEDLYPS